MNPFDCVTVATDAVVGRLVAAAERRLVVLAPALPMDVAKAVVEKASTATIPVDVILDSDPEAYRLGYGAPEALNLLLACADEKGITLRRQPGLRLCVVVADLQTLIFTPTPRLIEAGSNTDGAANAVWLREPPRHLLDDIVALPGQPCRVGRETLSGEDVRRIQANLAENPPQQFDIARRLRVFNAYWEFVEFEISGVHVSRRQVTIPSHLSGIGDSATRERLRSTFRLVSKDDELSGAHLRRDRDLIANRYLTVVPRFGSIVKRADKRGLLAAVEELRLSVDAFREKVRTHLYESMTRSREALMQVLLPAIVESPPAEWYPSTGVRPDADACRKYLAHDLERAFGSADQLVGRMEVRLQFRGITYETLMDEKFLAAAAAVGLDTRRLHEEFDAARGAQTGNL